VLLQILDKELTHLEKAACHLDPVVQRAEAATVKLLASALLQVCGFKLHVALLSWQTCVVFKRIQLAEQTAARSISSRACLLAAA
jgi:hypothetical protein